MEVYIIKLNHIRYEVFHDLILSIALEKRIRIEKLIDKMDKIRMNWRYIIKDYYY